MVVGLTQIRGVGYMFANTILNVLKINLGQKLAIYHQNRLKQLKML